MLDTIKTTTGSQMSMKNFRRDNMKKRYVLLGALAAAAGAGAYWMKKHVKVVVHKECKEPDSREEDGSTLFVGGESEREEYLSDMLDQKIGSFVITDPKGRYFDKFAKQLSECGYEVKILNLTDSDKIENDCGTQCSFDPFEYIDTSKESEELVIDTVEILAGTNFRDEFEKKAVTYLLMACVYWLKENQCEADGNDLKFLSFMLKEAKNNPTFCYLLEKAFMGLSGQTKAKKYFQAAKQAAGRELVTVIQKAADRLEQISNANGIECRDNLELKNIGEDQTALFIITSEDCKEHKLIELLYMQLISCIYEERRKKTMDDLAKEWPVYCFLDQFEKYPNVPKIKETIQTGKLYSVYPVVCVPKFEQKKMNPADFDRITSCDIETFKKVEKCFERDEQVE